MKLYLSWEEAMSEGLKALGVVAFPKELRSLMRAIKKPSKRAEAIRNRLESENTGLRVYLGQVFRIEFRDIELVITQNPEAIEVELKKLEFGCGVQPYSIESSVGWRIGFLSAMYLATRNPNIAGLLAEEASKAARL